MKAVHEVKHESDQDQEYEHFKSHGGWLIVLEYGPEAAWQAYEFSSTMPSMMLATSSQVSVTVSSNM